MFLKQVNKIARQHSWKEQNKKDVRKLLQNTTIWKQFMNKYIDIDKWNQREWCMLENIKNNIKQGGNVVILTGTAHLDFFEQQIPYAHFPLR